MTPTPVMQTISLLDPETGDMAKFVWDPNFPNESVTLRRFSGKHGEWGRRIELSRDDARKWWRYLVGLCGYGRMDSNAVQDYIRELAE